MPPKCFESEVESFLEGSHGDRTHNKQRADHHTVTPLCGTLLSALVHVVTNVVNPRSFLRAFLICCYKRRQSEGFFADNGGFWAWIDDVCNRGPCEAM